MLEQLVENAVRMIDSPYPRSPDAEAPKKVEDAEEGIEGVEDVTLILHAPGYRSGEILVSAAFGEVQVAAPSVSLWRQLPPDVDQSTAE